jgi:hypothetical protein
MLDATLNDLLTELRAIRAALETRPPVAPRAVATAATAPKGDAVIPQPAEIVPNAGDVTVHFGKNSGVALKDLTERSLSWYAEEQPPKLRDDGTPFLLRPADLALKNAARTLWHERNGTLAGTTATPAAPRPETPPIPYREPRTNLADTPRQPKPAAPKSQVEEELDSTVPF